MSTSTDMYSYFLGTQGQSADPLEQLVSQPLMANICKHNIHLLSVLLGDGSVSGVEGDGRERRRIDDGHDAVLLLVDESRHGGRVAREVADGGGGWRCSSLMGGDVVVGSRGCLLDDGRALLVDVPRHGVVSPSLDGGLGPALLADQHTGLGDGHGIIDTFASLPMLLLQHGIDDVELDLATGRDALSRSHVLDAAGGTVHPEQGRLAVRCQLALRREETAHVPDRVEDAVLGRLGVRRRCPDVGVLFGRQLPPGHGQMDPDGRGEDLRIDADDNDVEDADDDVFVSSTSTPDLVSSFSSSWHKTRSHLVFAEEIIASVESEAMMAQDDPFAKDANFSVGADGLVTVETCSPALWNGMPCGCS